MKSYIINKNKHHSKDRELDIILYNNKFIKAYYIKFKKVGFIKGNGINKLIGYSNIIHAEKPFGKIPIVKNYVNSLIIGWKYNPSTDKVDIYNYTDERGVEKREKLNISIAVNKGFFVSFYFLDGMLCYDIIVPNFDLGINEYQTHKIRLTKPRIGYRLFPYFGGKKPAPNEIEIGIEEISFSL